MGGVGCGGSVPPVITRSAPTTFSNFRLSLNFIIILAIFSLSVTADPINITAVLCSYPQLSSFSSLLSSTAVSSDLSSRTSLTILAVPNRSLLPSAVSSASASASLADILRYHVLLRYLTWQDLRQIPPSGTLIPTLYSTTGRAADNFGSLNLTFDPSNGVVSIHPPTTSPHIPNFLTPNPSTNLSSSNNNNPPSPADSATVVSLVKTFPYNLSIFTVSSLIVPYGSDLAASETRPPSPGVNITKALIDGHGFNVAASMLAASGVVDEFEADEAGAGITLFVPTDEAFANLPPGVQLQSLPADQKALVLKFHVLHSYYPLGSLESMVNPMQPTLATEDSGAGRFTLNISRVNSSMSLNSGVVQAVVTQTVFDQNPVAIFGISSVLLPREMFGAGSDRSVDLGARKGTGAGAVLAPPPDIIEADSPVYSPPSHLSSPPGLRDEVGGSGPVTAAAAASASTTTWELQRLVCTGSFVFSLLMLV